MQLEDHFSRRDFERKFTDFFYKRDRVRAEVVRVDEYARRIQTAMKSLFPGFGELRIIPCQRTIYSFADGVVLEDEVFKVLENSGISADRWTTRHDVLGVITNWYSRIPLTCRADALHINGNAFTNRVYGNLIETLERNMVYAMEHVPFGCITDGPKDLKEIKRRLKLIEEKARYR